MGLRSIENRVYRLVRDARANGVAEQPATEWRPSALAGESYCVLVSFRASGAPVATPVWFGVDGDRVYVRSGRDDGKVRRIRRTPGVLVAACNARGRPTGPPMRGVARILEGGDEEARAERALAASYGLGRRLYGAVRGARLDAAYIEVRGR